MKSAIRLTVVTLAIFLSGNDSEAGLVLYTVDTTSDELLKIDSSTGSISVVGTLDFTTADSSGALTFLNGMLYRLNRASPQPAPSYLAAIDPDTAETISTVPVTVGGFSPIAAEGLSHIGGELLIAYGTSGVNASDHLGILGFDGVISDTVDFSAFSDDFDNSDFDSIAADVSGQIYSQNTFNVSGTERRTRFYLSNRTPASHTAIGPYITFTNSETLTDLTFTSTGELFGIDRFQQRLYQFEPTNGSILNTVQLDTNRVYLGLAADMTVVPEPSAIVATASLAAIAFAIVLSRR